MTAPTLDQNIARLRAEAAAQRVKAAETRRRASWWLPAFRGLLKADAAALEMGADELDAQADRWAAVLPSIHKES